MTPIIIIITLIIIISSFTLGFLYNEMFLYFASILTIIFGLLILTGGVDLEIGDVTTTSLNETTNETISNTIKQYENINDHLTQGVGLLFILLGIGFTYFEKQGRNTGKDEWGQDGKWL